jgi:hypothetical protein
MQCIPGQLVDLIFRPLELKKCSLVEIAINWIILHAVRKNSISLVVVNLPWLVHAVHVIKKGFSGHLFE